MGPASLSTFACVRGRACFPFCSAGPWQVFRAHAQRILAPSGSFVAEFVFLFCSTGPWHIFRVHAQRILAPLGAFVAEFVFLFAALDHGTSSLSIPDFRGQRRQQMSLLIQIALYRYVTQLSAKSGSMCRCVAA